MMRSGLLSAVLALLASVNFAQGELIGNDLIPRPYGSDGDPFIFVANNHAMPSVGQIDAFVMYNEAGGSGTTFAFDALVLRPTGNAHEFTVLYDSGPLYPGNYANETIISIPIGPVAVQAGDLIGYWGRGIPVDINGENPQVFYTQITLPSGTFTATPYPGSDAPPGARTYGFAANFNAVPEPSSLVLVGIGLAVCALGATVRRRAARVSA